MFSVPAAHPSSAPVTSTSHPLDLSHVQRPGRASQQRPCNINIIININGCYVDAPRKDDVDRERRARAAIAAALDQRARRAASSGSDCQPPSTSVRAPCCDCTGTVLWLYLRGRRAQAAIASRPRPACARRTGGTPPPLAAPARLGTGSGSPAPPPARRPPGANWPNHNTPLYQFTPSAGTGWGSPDPPLARRPNHNTPLLIATAPTAKRPSNHPNVTP
eukprot:1191743-Prorocentrum_minimum.AAC.5